MTEITRLSFLKDVVPAIARADLMSIPERLAGRGKGIGLISTPGNSQVVVISDPELLRSITLLDETPEAFANRGGEIYNHLRQRGPNGEPGDVLDGGPFSQEDSELWRRTRSAAKMTNTREIAKSILEHFSQLLEVQRGNPKIDLLDLLKKSFIHGLSLRLFGPDMQEVGQARLASYAPEYFERMAWQLLFALLPGKKGFGREKYMKTGQALGSVLDEMIDTAQRHRSKFTGSLLDQLLSEFDVNDSVERQVIKGTLGTEVMAGFDSVGVIVAQACRELAKNHLLQAELRDEGSFISQGGVIVPRMLRHLRKTKGFWELSTHKTPAFRVIFRHVARDHTLTVKQEGVTVEHVVRPGDELLLVLSGAHHNPAYWNNENMTLSHTMDGWTSKEKYAHLPYGAEERECMGKSLAEMTGPLLIATLLQQCVVELPRLYLPGVAMAMTSPLRSTRFKVKWLKAS